MGFTLEVGVPVFTVFIQGLLSFFSPCVLPLLPVYIGYLAGETQTIDVNGERHYPRKRVFFHTVFFVIGVSFAFFLLGFGFTALGNFFSDNRALLARIGGVLVIFFGLYQVGLFRFKAMSREHRLPLQLDRLAMNPLVALLLGFTFSFAWTPCVGPALSSVLLMASSAQTSARGFLLIGVYTLGFILPFLAVGLFTGTLLGFFKKHKKVVRYTAKAGGVLLIVMGVMMITGWMNGITGYLSQFGATAPRTAETQQDVSRSMAGEAETKAKESSTQQNLMPAWDFTLTDQYGQTHTISEYRGKVIFLNFWASWCGPCQREMPDIQQLFEESGGNAGELIVLGVANPKTDAYPGNQDGTQQEVETFLSKGGYTYPTAMDLTGEMFSAYQVYSFPTTFMIDRDGNVFGYVTGAMTRSVMDQVVRQTLDGKRTPITR